MVDVNRNGLDDGEETQANIYRAFFDASDRFPGLVNGAFLWNNWIHTEEMWARYWARERHYGIRGKPAEAVVRVRSRRPAARRGVRNECGRHARGAADDGAFSGLLVLLLRLYVGRHRVGCTTRC